MTRLGFLIARTLRQEAPLMALSMPKKGLMQRFVGQRIALVGNARSLAEGRHGGEIDSADLVIRINRAPMPDATSHGTRTDALALATSLDKAAFAHLSPDLVLWMSHKRKRLPWHVARHPGFYLHPLRDWRDLHDRLGAPPTTGLMMIDLLARSEMTSLTLYGFDFFASLSLTGRRRADQVPHDFTSESDFVTRLIAQDRRITLIGGARGE